MSQSGLLRSAGEVAIDEAARMPSDWSLSAIVGTAGLMPGLRVVERGGTLALANKESLVAAGPMLMGRARASGLRRTRAFTSSICITSPMRRSMKARVASAGSVSPSQ